MREACYRRPHQPAYNEAKEVIYRDKKTGVAK